MIKFSFNEWSIDFEESRRQDLMSRDVQAMPSVGDVIISNPMEFFDKTLYVPQGKGAETKTPKLKGVKVTPQELSSWVIEDIKDKAIETSRMIHGTYASRVTAPSKGFHPARLRDVTDSFEKGNKRYFIDLGKSKQVEDNYKIYQGLTRKQFKSGNKTDLEDLHIANVLGGDEPTGKGKTSGQQAAANMLNQDASDEKKKQWLWLAQACKHTDLTTHPEVRDAIVNDPDHVFWLRKIGAGNLVDFFHEKGYNVAGEPNKKDQINPPSELEKLVGPPTQKAPGASVFTFKDLHDLVRRNQLRQGTFDDGAPKDLEVAWNNWNFDKKYDYIT